VFVIAGSPDDRAVGRAVRRTRGPTPELITIVIFWCRPDEYDGVAQMLEAGV
jgi:hypothetical protein